VLTAALGGTSSQIENAAEKRMARRRQVLAKISLDKIIKTMRAPGGRRSLRSVRSDSIRRQHEH